MDHFDDAVKGPEHSVDKGVVNWESLSAVVTVVFAGKGIEIDHLGADGHAFLT